MFENHFGLRENPFVAGHQSRFVYPSREHQEALAHLRFGIENFEPFVLITGEVGTGKTTALYDVLAEYESRAVVALITNSSLTRDELLEEICLRFGLGGAGQLTKPQAIVALERYLKQVRARGHHAILILDEAQNLERDLLEEIRLLSNLEEQGNKLIQLFLVGQPELEEKLARSELRQLRQRITVFYRLRPLTADDTEHYIHHRISVAGGHALSVFPVDACKEVHNITHGIPREINTVAAQALLNAFVEDAPSVRPEHVRSVERDNEFRSVLRGPGGGRVSSLDTAPADSPLPAEVSAGASGATTVASAMPGPVASAVPGPGAAGPPPLIPAEPRVHVASTAPAPPPSAPVHHAPPAIAPAASGPPPLAPADTYAAPASPQAASPPAPGPPQLHPSEGSPGAAHARGAPTPPASGDGAQRKPGAVAPAGSSEDWGTWLSSLSQLPSAFDETLEEALNAADDPAAQAAPAAVAPATQGAAPARVDAHVETAAPERVEPPRMEPPRMQAPGAAPSSAAQKSSERDSGSRLPRRLEFLDEEPAEEGGKNLRWMIIAGFVAVIAVGAVLGIRAWMSSAKSTSAVPASMEAPTTTTETTPSSSPTATSDPGTSASTAGGSTPASSSPPPVRPTPQTASSVPPTQPGTSTSSATGAHPPAGTVPTPASTVAPPVATSAPSTPAPTHGTATGVAGGAAGAAAASGGTAAAAGATAGGAAVGSASAGGAAVGGASAGGASAAGGAAVGAQSATPSQGAFGIAVGTYLEEERAKEEGVKLTASTKLPAHVAPVTENESTMYRLVLGSFESRKQAEKTASSLIERGLVDEARVVPLGTTTASKQ